MDGDIDNEDDPEPNCWNPDATTLMIDECGVCDGGCNSGCRDADGACDDECSTYCDCDGNVEDECGICGGDGLSCNSSSDIDCDPELEGDQNYDLMMTFRQSAKSRFVL